MMTRQRKKLVRPATPLAPAPLAPAPPVELPAERFEYDEHGHPWTLTAEAVRADRVAQGLPPTITGDALLPLKAKLLAAPAPDDEQERAS